MTDSLLDIVLRSLAVSGSATIIGMLAGVPLGLTMGLWRLKRNLTIEGRRSRAIHPRLLMVALVNTGMGFPPVVMGVLIAISLSRSGPLGFLEMLYSPQAMVIAQFLLCAPLAAGITYAAVASVPTGALLQLRSLGASNIQAGLAILREARLGVMAAGAVAFGQVISEVGAVTIVGGNIEGSTRVITSAIVLGARQGEYIAALLLGAVLLSLLLLANLFVAKAQEART